MVTYNPHVVLAYEQFSVLGLWVGSLTLFFLKIFTYLHHVPTFSRISPPLFLVTSSALPVQAPILSRDH